MHIIHLSDLHFCTGIPLAMDEDRVISAIKKAVSDTSIDCLYLCITGDIVLKGDVRAYTLAEFFLKKLCSEIKIKKEHIIICPGNHDFVVSKQSFDDYNKFVFSLTRNDALMLSKHSISPYFINELCFLVVNSTYHLDHTYGLIELNRLQEVMEGIDSCCDKILCLHHHLLPTDDFSCLKNAYSLLNLCTSTDIKLILHGHRHMNLHLTVGNSSLLISGSGSLFQTSRQSGYTNQFQSLIIDRNNSKIYQKIFRYLIDSHDKKNVDDFYVERYEYGILR
ncbi:MAG: metallophosphoesterase [Desulfovibrionales bacterium]|nr:metallophosphoesterase [Desulfovibrionales bacterium]